MRTGNRKSSGFTLVELILVIVVLGILATATTSYLGLGARMYAEASDRDQLLSQSRFALERLTRELRNALPNSVRLHDANNGSQCIEFVPVVVAARYTTIPTLTQPGNSIPLFSMATEWVRLSAEEAGYIAESKTFRVYIYATDRSQIYPAAHSNPGRFHSLNSADLYNIVGVSAPFAVTLNLSGNVSFSNSSPSNRLYLADQPVSYCITVLNQLLRYEGYGYSTSGPTFDTNDGVLMAKNLNTLQSSFVIEEPVLSRNSVVHVVLAFESGFSDDLFFNQEVHIPNVP
ncbi:prepilin-type N-terminal cleavage/methylation domain-containing protein [Rheinheimera soli]|uniref:MSHA biogenesis protein MshO n=1 Tax=Rheinheimera soli TaxID=443616 RepID=A0ABU1W2G0_9GAMM|nr:prepilin-type N-terminal cleavage/methylation domain-containing protein [Rheinheimera soli]MDR7122117.1 MSHA biogenesis protein MshO [Rheinheimera soli]